LLQRDPLAGLAAALEQHAAVRELLAVLRVDLVDREQLVGLAVAVDVELDRLIDGELALDPGDGDERLLLLVAGDAALLAPRLLVDLLDQRADRLRPDRVVERLAGVDGGDAEARRALLAGVAQRALGRAGLV